MSEISEAALRQLRRAGWTIVARYEGPPGSGKTTRATAQARRIGGRSYAQVDGDIVLAPPPALRQGRAE